MKNKASKRQTKVTGKAIKSRKDAGELSAPELEGVQGGAVDMFLKIDGIPETTDDKHKDWIEVLSFNTGTTKR